MLINGLRVLLVRQPGESGGPLRGSRHRVSATDLLRLVTALERELDLKLFERHTQGLSLTASGARYLEACQPALAMLADADQQAAATTNRARGTVVVGVQPVIAQQCLTPALPRFNALYPDIQLDIRYLIDTSEEECRGVDVVLVLGWPDRIGDLVHRARASSASARKFCSQSAVDGADENALISRCLDADVVSAFAFCNQQLVIGRL